MKRWTDRAMLLALEMRDKGYSLPEISQIISYDEKQITRMFERVDRDLERSEREK